MNKDESKLILIPCATIHPSYITCYNEVHWEPRKPYKEKSSYNAELEMYKYQHLLESNRTADGKVSTIAQRKIKKAIDYLLLFASDQKILSQRTGRKFNFKIAFITLTLPSKQIHTDNEIKRECLNQFIIELQKYHQVKNYVWRAEQQKNGNIHFHIITDKFIHWNDVRNRWNRIVNKLGYVDRYREAMKKFYKDGFKVRENLLKSWSKERQYFAYKRNLETDYHSPNSTDIHSIKKIRNLQSYFVKYMTKNEPQEDDKTETKTTNRKQQGRVWGSSNNLQNLKGAQIVMDSELQEELNTILDNSNCKAYVGDYFTCYYINFKELNHYGNNRLFNTFANYLVKEFDYSVQLFTPG